MWTWDRDYSWECNSCWERYNAVPRQEPCHQHKGQVHVHRQMDDTLKGSTYVWHMDDSPYDFSGEPKLLHRLHFMRWLWRYRMDESQH